MSNSILKSASTTVIGGLEAIAAYTDAVKYNGILVKSISKQYATERLIKNAGKNARKLDKLKTKYGEDFVKEVLNQI